MSHRTITPTSVPAYWTPDETLAVFEFLDLLRDQIWTLYALDTQAALRADTATSDDPRQMRLSTDPNPPF